MNHSVRVRAGATVANLAVGFDILGLAVTAPFDEIVASESPNKAVQIEVHGSPLLSSSMPATSQGDNTAVVAVRALLQHSACTKGVALTLYKGMPIGSGLGSSAASAAAAVVAVNELYSLGYTREALVHFVQESEKSACGTPHADNAAPALMGGIVAILSYSPLTLRRVHVPSDLCVAILHPKVELKTELSRKALSRQLTLTQHTEQCGSLAGFLLALQNEDYDLLRSSIRDGVIEPQRALMIPGFYEMQRGAIESGALGCSISGSGPSLFALCRGESQAQVTASAMKRIGESLGLECAAYSGYVLMSGAYVVENKS